MIWLIEVNGLSFDARELPAEIHKAPRYQPLSTCRAMTIRWTWLVPS